MKKLYKKNQSGIAIIEFALVVPVFAFAYISLVITSDYYFAVKSVDRATNFLAEWVSTQQTFTLEDGVVVKAMAHNALLPYTKNVDATVIVASLGNDNTNVYTIWCYSTFLEAVDASPNCSGTDTASLNNFFALSGGVEVIVTLQYTPLGASNIPVFLQARKVRPLREVDQLPWIDASN